MVGGWHLHDIAHHKTWHKEMSYLLTSVISSRADDASEGDRVTSLLIIIFISYKSYFLLRFVLRPHVGHSVNTPGVESRLGGKEKLKGGSFSRKCQGNHEAWSPPPVGSVIPQVSEWRMWDRAGSGLGGKTVLYGFSGYKKSYTRRNFRGAEKTLSNKITKGTHQSKRFKGRLPTEIVGKDWEYPTVRGVLRPSTKIGLVCLSGNQPFFPKWKQKSATSEKILYLFGDRPAPVSAN